MFENVIEFIAPEEYIKNNQDLLPCPIKLNIPDWYKEKSLQHVNGHKTVKGCMPFLDAMTAGYLLKMPTDYYLEHNLQIDGKKATGVICANRLRTKLSQNINLNYETVGEYHETYQLGKSPILEKNKNLPLHKILNPWTIKTPPGYSCLFCPPLNNTDNRFSIIPGIVDTDSYNLEVNFPIVINGDKYPSLKTTIKKGTPYVQVIPFKRDKWKMKTTEGSKSKDFIRHLKITKFLWNNYKNLFWNKKKWS